MSPVEGAALMGDPLWRIRNLYSIRSAAGPIIDFRPRPEQEAILRAIFEKKYRRLIILKARQIGFSTLLGVIFADTATWRRSHQLSLIDQTQRDAQQKLWNIVRVAYESIKPTLRVGHEVVTDNSGEFTVRLKSLPSSAASSVFAGTHARGGTNNWLWISEWGIVNADDVARSEEILTGAIPSAKDGTVIVETTWKGGKPATCGRSSNRRRTRRRRQNRGTGFVSCSSLGT